MGIRTFISVPMRGKSDEEIREAIGRAIERLEPCGYEAVDGYMNMIDMKTIDFTSITQRSIARYVTSLHLREQDVNAPIYYLSASLKKMSTCKAAYFCKGWEQARGCQIEHEVAKEYGLDIIYET